MVCRKKISEEKPTENRQNKMKTHSPSILQLQKTLTHEIDIIKKIMTESKICLYHWRTKLEVSDIRNWENEESSPNYNIPLIIYDIKYM